MGLVLLVEDNRILINLIKGELEKILGIEVDTANNYKDSVSMIERHHYAAYVIGDKIPRAKDSRLEPIGLDLAKYVHQRGVPYDNIAFLSSDFELIREAKELGVTIIYIKVPTQEIGKRNISLLAEDLRPLLAQ